jgi:hypothetical protein
VVTLRLELFCGCGIVVFMFDSISSFLAQAAVVAALSGALIWLTRSWISERLANSIRHEYEIRLEAYKSELRAESEIAIEKLKSQLQLTAVEHQIRFAKLHEKVAEVLAETYARLMNLQLAVGDYVKAWESTSGPSKSDRRIVAAKAMQEVNEYYLPRKLFIHPDAAKKVEELRNRLFRITTDFMISVEQPDYGKQPDIAEWGKAYKAMTDDVAPMFKSLEAHFQKLLGLN